MSDEQKTNDENVATMEPERIAGAGRCTNYIRGGDPCPECAKLDAALDEIEVTIQPCEESPAQPLDELKARHYAQILACSKKVRELRILRDETKEAASAAKKRWERASDELDDLTARGPNPQRVLDFDKPAATGDDAPLLDAAEAAEEWRTLPIETLDIPPKAIEKLQDVGIGTLGDFTDWQKSHNNEQWYQDIKGIGEAAATRISDAWEAFWASRPADQSATTEGRRVRLLVDIDGVGKAGDTFEIDHEEIADAEQVGIVVASDVAGRESTTLVLNAGEFEYCD